MLHTPASLEQVVHCQSLPGLCGQGHLVNESLRDLGIAEVDNNIIIHYKKIGKINDSVELISIITINFWAANSLVPRRC